MVCRAKAAAAQRATGRHWHKKYPMKTAGLPNQQQEEEEEAGQQQEVLQQQMQASCSPCL